MEAHASTRHLSVHAGGTGGGVNAIEKTIPLIVAPARTGAALGEHEVPPDPAAGLRHAPAGDYRRRSGGGGDGRLNLFSNAGTTPNYCSVEYNMWYYPDESFEDVQAEVEKVVAAICSADPWLRDHPPHFTWKLGQIYFPPLDVPLDHPAVERSEAASTRSGSMTPPRAFGAATDLAWYGERELPGIICGPGRLAQCHVADEYLETEQLALAASVYALMLAEWCA